MKYETRLDDEITTIIPSYIARKYNLQEGDIVEWIEEDDGVLMISFKKNYKSFRIS